MSMLYIIYFVRCQYGLFAVLCFKILFISQCNTQQTYSEE